MKKMITIAMALFIGIANAQDVPEKVQKAFAKKYPKAEGAEWSSDGTNHDATFADGEANKTARFDKGGKWVETRTTLTEEELPEPVSKTVKKKYKEGTVNTSSKYENAKKEVYYEINVTSKKGDTFMLHVDAAGKVLKTEKQAAEEEKAE